MKIARNRYIGTFVKDTKKIKQIKSKQGNT